MRHRSESRWQQWIISALAFGIFMPAAHARIDIVANAWEYFEFFNLSRFYDHYSTIIDLLIYILLFTGLVRVALEHRFPGRGGKAIAVGLGFILGVAMTIAGEAYGFSIKSFGPLAVSFLALLIGITLYRILRSGGIGRSRAGPLAFLILFVVMLAIAPELFGWFNDYAPLANVLLLIGFLLSLGVLGVSMISGGLRSTQDSRETLTDRRAVTVETHGGAETVRETTMEHRGSIRKRESSSESQSLKPGKPRKRAPPLWAV